MGIAEWGSIPSQEPRTKKLFSLWTGCRTLWVASVRDVFLRKFLGYFTTATFSFILTSFPPKAFFWSCSCRPYVPRPPVGRKHFVVWSMLPPYYCATTDHDCLIALPLQHARGGLQDFVWFIYLHLMLQDSSVILVEEISRSDCVTDESRKRKLKYSQ